MTLKSVVLQYNTCLLDRIIPIVRECRVEALGPQGCVAGFENIDAEAAEPICSSVEKRSQPGECGASDHVVQRHSCLEVTIEQIDRRWSPPCTSSLL